jgi:CHAT domain-containing protein
MPQNKAFKNIILVICVIAFGYSACENNDSGKAEIDSQEVTKIPYKFEDQRVIIADSLQEEGEYELSFQEYHIAESSFRKEENWEGLLYTYNQQAILYRRLGELEEAHSYFNLAKAMMSKEIRSNHFLFVQAYYYEMIRIFREGDYEKAAALNDTAFSISKQSEFYDSLQLRNLYRYKFYTYYYSKLNYDSALKYLDKRKSINVIMRPGAEDLFTLLIDYTVLYRAKGDYQKAIAYGQEALRIAIENVDSVPEMKENELFAQFQIGAALRSSSDFAQATDLGEKILKDYSKYEINDVENQLSYLNFYAVSLQNLEEYDLAAVQFQRFLTLMESIQSINESYWSVVMNLGWNYYLDGKTEKGLPLLTKALIENKKLFGLFHTSNVLRYVNIGEVLKSKGEYEQALFYYDSAMRSAIPDYNNSIYQLPNETQVNLTYDELIAIKGKLKTFMDVYKENLDRDLLASILKYTDFIHSILVENRKSYEDSQGKLFLSEDFKEMYAIAIEANFILYNEATDELERKKYASNVTVQMNRSKAVLFLEQSGEYDLIRRANVSDELKEEYYTLLNQLDALDQSFYSLTENLATSDTIRIINSDRMIVNSRLMSLKDSIFNLLSYPTVDLNVDNDQIQLALNKFLTENENLAVVEYFVSEENIYYTVNFDKKNELFKVELEEEFKNEFSGLLEEVSNKPTISENRDSFQKFTKNSFAIQQKLIEPVLNSIPSSISHLILIPDEFLSKLPFEVLLQSDRGDNFFNADYLIKDYGISYSLSSRLIGSSKTVKRASKNLIGFGYSGETVAENRSTLGALPGAIAEIEYLEENIAGEYFTGKMGTKANFISVAGEYDIIHLAIHGISDSTDRYNSQLIFNGNDDNIMQTKDLYRANLNSRLVVLSACESGVGEISEGEGTFSIARGFALTGTEAIVMSLWNVDDGSSSELMLEFYGGLNSNLTVSASLINSKRKYLLSGNNYGNHPYYWASFVMLGSDIDLGNGGNKKLWLYGLLLFIGGIIVIIIKKKRA